MRNLLGLVLLAICCFSCAKEKLTCDNFRDDACQPGTFCTDTPSGNCSAGLTIPDNFIEGYLGNTFYCCEGTGGGTTTTTTTAYCNPGNTYNTSSHMCCPTSAKYYYPGTHGIVPAGCYKTCPYVNDCGNMFISY